MSTVNLGRIGFVNKGVYVGGSTTYKVNDVVAYDNSIYVCIQAHTDEHAPSDTLYWQLWINSLNQYTKTDVNSFINRSYIDSYQKLNLAVGWYTIATNTGDRAYAKFAVWDTQSGYHQTVIFQASHKFGTDVSNVITVTHNSSFGGTPLKNIRIKENDTYEGAVLQIYVDESNNLLNCAILGENIQTNGWVLTDWIPDAVTPPDVDNYPAFTEKSKVDLDNASQGGFITTGELYAGGDLTQYKVWHQGNDGAGSGLDADLLDGHDSSYFTPLTSPTFTGTPTAPTAPVGTNSTQLATTSFVKSEISSMFNVSGSAPMYACRAWVSFNGTNTVAIRASGNVSSITDNGVGQYTVNFTTAMPDANYTVNVTTGGTSNAYWCRTIEDAISRTVSRTAIHCLDGSTNDVDPAYVSIVAFR